MWKSRQVLENAEKDKKGDYGVYSYYVSLLKQSEVASDFEKYSCAIRCLKKILEIEK